MQKKPPGEGLFCSSKAGRNLKFKSTDSERIPLSLVRHRAGSGDG